LSIIADSQPVNTRRLILILMLATTLVATDAALVQQTSFGKLQAEPQTSAVTIRWFSKLVQGIRSSVRAAAIRVSPIRLQTTRGRIDQGQVVFRTTLASPTMFCTPPPTRSMSL
jgi:hypothetical protein